MGLTATLDSGLDCTALGNALMGQLAGPGGALGTVSASVDGNALASVTGAAGSVDANPVAAAAAQLAGRIPQALASLPGVGSVVQPLTALVGIAGQVAANDVPVLFEQVLGRARAELERPGGGGHAALLLRIAELLRDAPEGQALRQLLTALVPALGPTLQGGAAGAFPFLDILRGVEGATQMLGGLMCLETVLAEAERLSALLSVRLDPQALTQQQQALAEALGSSAGALAARLAAVDAGDEPAVNALAAEVNALAVALGELRERFAYGLAMDEATLTYLDIGRLQAEVEAARSMIRLADAAPARRVFEALAGLLQPLLGFPVPPSPAGGVAALLDQVQAQVATVAASINALDLGFITNPLATALRTLTAPLRELQALIEQVLLALRGALDQVRAAVAALPLEELAETIRSFLAPVARALDAVTALVQQVLAGLQAAADAASAALGQVDGALDAFKTEIDAFFGQAQAAVEQVNLQAVMGELAAKVQELAALLAKAELGPIFEGAVTAINTATDVVDAVPFDLLPESMKSEVDALAAPIKAVDVDGVQEDIQNTLGITEDGRFALREDLEAAIAAVHAKFQALLDMVEQKSPRLLLAELDQALEDLAAKVREVEPELALEPVREALAGVQSAIAGIDLAALLQPVTDAFGQVTAALDSLSVAQAIAPVQAELDSARQALIGAIRLEQWEKALGDLRTQTLALLDRANPQQLRAPIEGLLDEVVQTLARLPALNAGAGLGTVVAAMLGASGRRIQPESFGVVLGWLSSPAATVASTALGARSAALAAGLARAGTLVAAVDPAAAGTLLNARLAALASATSGLAARLAADVPAKLALTAIAPRLDGSALFGELAANRQRYQQALAAAAALAEGFRASGYSEADVGVAALRQAIAPLEPARSKVRQLFAAVGLAQGELSAVGALRLLLQAATPVRLVGLVMPVFEALHARLAHLLDSVIDPLLAATADLRALLAAVDLAPLVAAADGIVAQARTEIEALSPARLLAEPLQSFATLKSALVDNDPLDAVSAILVNLQELIARVLEKLDLEKLLEVPLEIYDDLLAQVRALDPNGLLTPVFDQIDLIASQVADGLDNTVASFKRLQDALPAGGGGSTASVSVDV